MLEKTTNISKRFYYYISNAFTDMTKIWHHPKINEHISFFIIFLCWVEHVCLFCLCFIPACRVSFVRFYINWPAASSASSSSSSSASSSAGPQLQALDRSVPCQKQQAEDQSVPRQTSTASATSQCSPPETASPRSECSPPDLNCKRYIAVFPAGNSKPRIRVFPARLQLQALDSSVPRQARTASPGSKRSPPDFNCKR